MKTSENEVMASCLRLKLVGNGQKEMGPQHLSVDDKTDLARATREGKIIMKRESGTICGTIDASTTSADNGSRKGSKSAHLAHWIPLRPNLACSTLIGKGAEGPSPQTNHS